METPLVPLTRKRKRSIRRHHGDDHNEEDDRAGQTTFPRSKHAQRRARDPMAPLGYALRLSEYHDYGRCGIPEEADERASVDAKAVQLAAMIRDASHTVVHTGAGISTSAGIPDFRGIGGVWTRHKQGAALPASERCWNNAQPTTSHMALARLVEAGHVACIVTQNIDGLHVRSGVPRTKLAELHGNIFSEKCTSCGLVVTRSFDVGGVGFRPTGRFCHACTNLGSSALDGSIMCSGPSCVGRSAAGMASLTGGKGTMIDQLLDWEDALPDRDFDMADEHSEICAKKGGLAICLGTSMQMTPARDWPCKADKLVIVNLQPTIKDDAASLVVRAPVDLVLERVMTELGETIPTFRRSETFVVSHSVRVSATGINSGAAVVNSGDHSGCKWKLCVSDQLGAPCGFLLSVTVLREGSSSSSSSSSSSDGWGAATKQMT